MPSHNSLEITMPKCPRKLWAGLYIFTYFSICSLGVRPLNQIQSICMVLGHNSNIYSKRNSEGGHSTERISRMGLRLVVFDLTSFAHYILLRGFFLSFFGPSPYHPHRGWVVHFSSG